MRIALITMTRDRLAYTAHCFDTLEENAGCDYHHFVLDQRSADGSRRWLENWDATGQGNVLFSKENIGICAGANRLLDLLDPSRYDVIVRYDNDCEVTQQGTLAECARLAADYGAIVSPHVEGLNNPPATLWKSSLGGAILNETAILGGIFMAIPAFLFTDRGYRFDETSPLATGDEKIVPWWRSQGGHAGYLEGWSVNHYETTEGQKVRYPAYQERKESELAAAI